jgi:hypothetical protein
MNQRLNRQTVFRDLRLEPDAAAQYLRLGHELEAAWREAGVKVRFMRGDTPTEFLAASDKTRAAALGYLDLNLAILREMAKSGESPRDTKRYLWRAIKKLELTPPADLLTYIESDDDIVEVYLLDEIQVFRSVRFFEISSLTIDEVLCKPWYRLVGRGWRPLLAMMRVVLRFRMGLIREPIPWGIPEHVAWEKETPERVHFMMKLKHFIPVRHQGRLVGMVGVNRSVPIPAPTKEA